MALVTLRAIVVLRKGSEANLGTALWFLRTFPTVEVRIRRGHPGASSYEPLPVDAAWESYGFEVEEQCETRLGGFKVGVVAYQGNKPAIQQAAYDLARCIEALIHEYPKESEQAIKYRFSKVLTIGIPFGSPISLSPLTTSTDFTEFNVSTSYLLGRAVPSWFPGTKSISAVSRLAATARSQADLTFIQDEYIAFVSHRSDDDREESLEMICVGVVSCSSFLQAPAHVSVSLLNTDVKCVRAVSEYVQRIDGDADQTTVILMPPSFESSNESCQLIRYQVETTSTGSAKLKNPFTAIYRLRKALCQDPDRAEFQLMMRLVPDSPKLKQAEIKRLDIKMFLPKEVTISSIKAQASIGEARQSGSSTIVWSIPPEKVAWSEPLLFSGIVECSAVPDVPSILKHESSFAMIDFEICGATVSSVQLNQILVDGQKGIGGIAKPTLRSKNCIVWNPFGDCPSSVPISLLLKSYEE